jgi:hypothetical protein
MTEELRYRVEVRVMIETTVTISVKASDEKAAMETAERIARCYSLEDFKDEDILEKKAQAVSIYKALI